ncbi:MAG: sensor histidine kinase, partial [Verrucomicrobiota bacterium]
THQSPLAPPLVPMPLWLPSPGRLHIRTRGEFRESYYFNNPGHCLLVGQSIAPELDKIAQFNRRLHASGLLVLVFGLLGGWGLTTRAIQPIETISTAARRISEGHLSERIDVTDERNELGRLAGVLNTTFDRLEDAFERQRRFTADASHELRTPLTVMISEAQTTLSKPRSAEEYRETVETCLDEAQRMRRLTASLLELSRLDSERPASPSERTDLGALALGILDHLETSLASGRGLRFHRDCASAPLDGHPEALVQVVTNLVSNAIQHTPPGGEVRVMTGSEGGEAVLMVSDTGAGIAAEDLPHVFERFYRADRSRTGSEGHAGLGLAIVKAIVENHRGGIEVESTLGLGTTVTVRFPGLGAPA